MILTLPLQPQDEARLIALAQRKVCPVAASIDKILADVPDLTVEAKLNSATIWKMILTR